MKGVTVALIYVLLMLGVGTARAGTSAFTVSSGAVSVDQEASPPDAPANSTVLYLDTDPSFRVDGNDEITARQSLTVWDYEITPQVTLDLGYRPFIMKENVSELVSDLVDMKQIAQNLMVEFRYQF